MLSKSVSLMGPCFRKLCLVVNRERQIIFKIPFESCHEPHIWFCLFKRYFFNVSNPCCVTLNWMDKLEMIVCCNLSKIPSSFLLNHLVNWMMDSKFVVLPPFSQHLLTPKTTCNVIHIPWLAILSRFET